jgi:hypothetical protein
MGDKLGNVCGHSGLNQLFGFRSSKLRENRRGSNGEGHHIRSTGWS